MATQSASDDNTAAVASVRLSRECVFTTHFMETMGRAQLRAIDRAVLESLLRVAQPTNPLFPVDCGTEHSVGVVRVFDLGCALAGLADVRRRNRLNPDRSVQS